MPRVTDKADLADGSEYDIDLALQTLTVNVAGAITAGSANGVVGQALFQSLQDLWKTGTNHNKQYFPFAMADGPLGTMFECREGWTISGIALIRSCGVAQYNTSDVLTDAWACFVQLGTVKTATDQPYHLLTGTTPTNFGVADEMNECIKIYENGSYDYRSSGIAKFFVRTAGDTYLGYDLLTEQGLSSLTYRSYSLPGSTVTDASVVTTGPTGSPYSGMTLTLGATTNTINSTSYDFAEGEIEANGGTVQQVYDWFQDLLLSTSNIDSGAGTQRGDTYLDGSLTLSGGTLTTSQGLTVKNIATADESNIYHVDDTGTARQETFVPTFTLNCVDADGNSTNFATGTRVRIYDTTNTSELYNNTPGAVSSVAVTFTSGPTVASLQYKIISVDGGTSATLMIKATSNISTADVSLNVTQVTDSVYAANGEDGSAVSGLSINANHIDIDINDADNTLTLQEMYAWYVYYNTTSAGIADSDDLINALTQVEYEFDDTVEVKNTKTGYPLTITGGNVTDESGAVTGWIDTSGENIYLIPESVVAFAYSSGSGLDSGQDTKLTNINDLVSTMDTLIEELHIRNDLNASKQNTYAADGSTITNDDFTLTKDGAGLVTRS